MRKLERSLVSLGAGKWVMGQQKAVEAEMVGGKRRERKQEHERVSKTEKIREADREEREEWKTGKKWCRDKKRK